jgi:antitoxin component of MazEF toxin-antitoxin module
LPLIRKIIDVGKTSRGVILPKSWLQNIEESQGQPIEAVFVEVNHDLRITPVLAKKQNCETKEPEKHE